MLSSAALAVLGATIVATAFLSGIFGMAGGLILLGVCLALLDVAPAMVLHGTTQFAANGWRTLLWRGHVHWGIVWRYLSATIAVYIAMRYLAVLPNKAVIYICIGLMPFATDLLPKSWTPDITKPGAPFLCGALMSLLQIMAGAAGNIVDVFFQNSALDRKQIVATKSATQTVGHLLRVAYFGSFASAQDQPIAWWVLGSAIFLAMAGTTLAGQALHRMSDADFRRYSRVLINSVSIVFLMRGLWLLAFG